MAAFLGELRALVNELAVTEVLYYDELFSATQLACSLATIFHFRLGSVPKLLSHTCLDRAVLCFRLGSLKDDFGR